VGTAVIARSRAIVSYADADADADEDGNGNYDRIAVSSD
jgi:hypothetical protein